MRKLIAATMLMTPFLANAGIIELGADTYWQVQDAATYTTLCEGNIGKCEVEPGVYNVINLNTGERQEGVVVAEDNQPAYSSLEIVKSICDFDELYEGGEDPFMPFDYGTVSCGAYCPVGKTFIGVRGCVLYSDHYASDYLEPEIVPTAFIAGEDGGICRSIESIPRDVPYRLEGMTVEISCL